MSYDLIRSSFPAIAASNVSARALVALTTSGQRAVVPLATNTTRPLGIVNNSASRGDACTVYDTGNYVKVTAAASIGRGAEVGIASSNGAFGPIAGASGVSIFSVGQSTEAAAAGEKFAVYVSPRQLSNLI